MNSENDDIGFIYKFDMSKDIAHFKLMPDDIQWSAERYAVEVIYDSFVVSGDQDYLMSRLLGQKGLPRLFFWAAAQATEKYLKAFLLMNGESVINFPAHPVRQLFKAASKIDNSLDNISIAPHSSIKIESCYSSLLKKYTIQQFLDELEEHGSADNRYNAFGVDYNTGHLCAMDSLSFHLRKKIGVIPIYESFRGISPDLILTFEKNNPWFLTVENQLPIQPRREDFPIHSSFRVTILDFLIKNESDPACKMALQWLNVKMKLPKIK